MILAYPDGDCPPGYKNKLVKTVVCPEISGEGWPNPIVGPNPNNVARAADFLKESAWNAKQPIIAASEDAVLAVGLANSSRNGRGIGLGQAIACTDRKTQRELLRFKVPQPKVLGYDDYTPKGPYVLRQPASVMSSGVILEPLGRMPAFYAKNDEILRLEQVHEPDYDAMYEEYIEGPQWEVSGAVDGAGRILPIKALHQRWNKDWTEIMGYEPVKDTELSQGLFYLAKLVSNEIGLEFCGFSMEFRGDGNHLMEVNARVGDEPDGTKGYSEVLGGNPVVLMLEALKRCV